MRSLLLAWCLFLAGCGLVAGLGDFEDAEPTDGGATGGSGGNTGGSGGQGATSSGGGTGGSQTGGGGSGGVGGEPNPLAQSAGMLYWCESGMVFGVEGLSEWINEAPNDHTVTQPNTSLQPARDPDRFGPGLDGAMSPFDATRLEVSDSPPISEFTTYLVLYRQSFTNNHGLLDFNSSHLRLSQFDTVLFNNGTDDVTISGAQFLTGRYLLVVQRNGSDEWLVWKNGVNSPTNGIVADATVFTIRRILGADGYQMDGSFGFWAFANVAHSTEERETIEQYLMNKYTLDSTS